MEIGNLAGDFQRARCDVHDNFAMGEALRGPRSPPWALCRAVLRNRPPSCLQRQRPEVTPPHKAATDSHYMLDTTGNHRIECSIVMRVN